MLEWNLKIYFNILNQESGYPKHHCVEMKCKCLIWHLYSYNTYIQALSAVSTS